MNNCTCGDVQVGVTTSKGVVFGKVCFLVNRLPATTRVRGENPSCSDTLSLRLYTSSCKERQCGLNSEAEMATVVKKGAMKNSNSKEEVWLLLVLGCHDFHRRTYKQ
jgi:hypothetical protein